MQKTKNTNLSLIETFKFRIKYTYVFKLRNK